MIFVASLTLSPSFLFGHNYFLIFKFHLPVVICYFNQMIQNSLCKLKLFAFIFVFVILTLLVMYFWSVLMASSSDSWMREFNEASKLADDINAMISGRSSLTPSGPETQRHMSTARRKITILRTRVETLQSLLSKLPGKQTMQVI